MSIDLPSASVSGRDGWEWNRLVDANRPEATTGRPTVSARSPTSEHPHQRIEALEAQLKKQNHRTQAIIDKYERLLEEKNQRIATEQTNESSPSRIAATVCRFCPFF